MSDITPEELKDFKVLVGEWLKTESDINKKTKELKELKNLKKNIYDPQIIKFMVDNNIGDLNTQNGKIKCNERKLKKPLNKVNIRDNLSKIMEDEIKIDQAMTLILQNRETVVKYTLTQPKK